MTKNDFAQLKELLAQFKEELILNDELFQQTAVALYTLDEKIEQYEADAPE